jgi:hypothetical protein
VFNEKRDGKSCQDAKRIFLNIVLLSDGAKLHKMAVKELDWKVIQDDTRQIYNQGKDKTKFMHKHKLVE